MVFDPFGDFASRGYLRNNVGEKDLDKVRRLEHETFRLNLPEALAALAGRPAVGYQDLLDTHRRLFGVFYPWAGRDRIELAPDRAIGKAGLYDLFAHPLDVRRAAEFALGLAADPAQMRARPGEIMGLLAYSHPFLDGNGRTIMTVHADLARRAGFQIDWLAIGKPAYLEALTAELRRPGRALDAFLAPFVKPAPAEPAATVEMLARHPGLGPRGGSAGAVLDALRPAEPPAAEPWDSGAAPLEERLRAFERRTTDPAAGEKAPPSPSPAPDAEPPTDPAPRRGPRP